MFRDTFHPRMCLRYRPSPCITPHWLAGGSVITLTESSTQIGLFDYNSHRVYGVVSLQSASFARVWVRAGEGPSFGPTAAILSPTMATSALYGGAPVAWCGGHEAYLSEAN